jgi:protein-disulfide isomerase
MDKKAWIIFSIIVVVLVGLFVWSASSNRGVDVSDVDSSKVLTPSEADSEIGDHVLGNPDAKVVIVEYGDFQCYGCSQLSPRLNTIIEEYKDTVAFVYRNFVIDGHQNSRFAIASAEAAGFQGKYWEMHDLIFNRQATWTNASIDDRTAIFVGFAESLGLDTTQFKADLDSSKITKKIDVDIALAKKQSITGTPTVFVNGQLLDSEIWGSDDKFKSYLNDRLKEAGEKPPKE